MSEKRKRDKLEYLRGYKIKKKEEAKMIKREKMERHHMGKEDVRVAATTLAPSSSSDASPSFPSFAPSHEVEDVGDVPRHTVGDVLLLECNTNGRGYYTYFFFFFLLFLFFLFFFRHMAESMQLHFQERNRKTIWVVKHVLGFMYHLCGWLLWGIVSALAQCRKPK